MRLSPFEPQTSQVRPPAPSENATFPIDQPALVEAGEGVVGGMEVVGAVESVHGTMAGRTVIRRDSCPPRPRIIGSSPTRKR